jgi:hypothetical protein
MRLKTRNRALIISAVENSRTPYRKIKETEKPDSLPENKRD